MFLPRLIWAVVHAGCVSIAVVLATPLFSRRTNASFLSPKREYGGTRTAS